MVLLKHLSNFLRTLKMPLINCEINILLTWSEKRIIVNGNVENQGPKFAVTDTKICVPVAALSAQDSEKLLQLKKGFQRIINWNKYQSEPTLKTRNRNLSYLINPSFQGVNRLNL